MKRRRFAQKAALATLSAAAITNLTKAAQDGPPKDFYEVRIYTKRFGGSGLDNFIEEALIPALNRQGVSRVGVFTQLHADQPGELYLVIPYSSLEHYGAVNSKLKSDDVFKAAGKNYDQKPREEAPYESFKSSLLEAFDSLPKMRATNISKSRLFELRTYMGHNENATRRKVDMFNQAELALFDQVGFHPVIFGHAVVGENQPNLTYMLVFDDMEQRDKNWATFVKHPDWNTMKEDPRWTNSVSKIIRTFLVPSAYSQI